MSFRVLLLIVAQVNVRLALLVKVSPFLFPFFFFFSFSSLLFVFTCITSQRSDHPSLCFSFLFALNITLYLFAPLSSLPFLNHLEQMPHKLWYLLLWAIHEHHAWNIMWEMKHKRGETCLLCGTPSHQARLLTGIMLWSFGITFSLMVLFSPFFHFFLSNLSFLSLFSFSHLFPYSLCLPTSIFIW